LKRLRIEFANDFFSLLTIGELDECESARAARFAIDGHGDVRWLSDSCEVGAQIGFARAVGKVPDEQTDCQGLLVKCVASRPHQHRELRRAGFDSNSKGSAKFKV
jgi:hypothetical protein